ncbi:MAG TPA: hypothetical protein VGQ08_12685 [Nitrospiraceae bacterium]|jgi:hypothetical protein|nr:hypothetical protein [Nitrospiraceae bacterium]
MISKASAPQRRRLQVHATIITTLLWVFVPMTVLAQEALLEWFPIRPINLDVVLRQQTFAPTDREITIQTGITALRYGDIEVRGLYRYFSLHSREFEGFQTNQHAILVNPRWNNFIDILDFPKSAPIHRTIRHILFGPLEDRAVPYVGLLAGTNFPGNGPTSPGHFIGGQLGVRFPIAFGVSLEIAVEYNRFQVHFEHEHKEAQQWNMTTGIRF